MAAGVAGAVSDAVDVILRDGGTIRLEPPTAADADALVDFFAGLSERSLYLRFHGYRGGRPRLVEPLLDPDWVGARRARRPARRRRRGADRRGRELRRDRRAATRPRWPSRSPTRSRAAASARGSSSSSRARAREHGIIAVRRRRPRLERDRARRLRRRRLRGRAASATPTRSSSASRSLPTREFEARVEQRDHTARRRLAPPVLRAAAGRRDRRLAPARLDRRRALPQHPRGRLRGRRLPRQPAAASRSPASARYRSVEEIPDPVDLAVICLPGEQVLDAADVRRSRAASRRSA